MTHLPPIGLSGFARSGKTTAAQYLESRYGYTRLHIADPLRRMLDALLVDFGIDRHTRQRYLEGDLKESVIPEIGVTSRAMQISLGTEWGRVCVSDDLWVKAWKVRASFLDTPAMNDSVRFPNEEAAIRELGGFTILIQRVGCGPAAFLSESWRWAYDYMGNWEGVHPSERIDLLNPTYVVENNGSLEDLYERLDSIMAVALPVDSL